MQTIFLKVELFMSFMCMPCNLLVFLFAIKNIWTIIYVTLSLEFLFQSELNQISRKNNRLLIGHPQLQEIWMQKDKKKSDKRKYLRINNNER